MTSSIQPIQPPNFDTHKTILCTTDLRTGVDNVLYDSQEDEKTLKFGTIVGPAKHQLIKSPAKLVAKLDAFRTHHGLQPTFVSFRTYKESDADCQSTDEFIFSILHFWGLQSRPSES